jgi:hypothetical protein
VKIDRAAQRVLQELETGDAMRIEGHELAVNHGILLDLLERLGDRLVVGAHNQAPA